MVTEFGRREAPRLSIKCVGGATEDLPGNLRGIARLLDPGRIVAGGIGSSRELIAITKTAAQAGLAQLCLIWACCGISVFVQIEISLHVFGHHQTALAAQNQLTRLRCRVNWILSFRRLMTVLNIGWLGVLAGGGGQAATMSIPVTGQYLRAVWFCGCTTLPNPLSGARN